MKLQKKLFLIALASVFSIAANADDYHYTNPVVAENFPDPTIIKYGKNYFAFHTGGCVPVYRSSDLVNWTSIGNAFTQTGKPSFVENGGIWAPDINKIGDQYVMYYSMSTWGGEWACGIGVATSTAPNKTFTDRGKLFISSEIGVQNSIDPFYIEDESGAKYLFWGSFRGIYGIELSDDGLSIKEGAEKFQIAGTVTEGTYIHKHGDYYYLIGSAGSCCEEERSTYHMVVARSKDLKGPYVDKNGKKALDNNFSTFLDANKEYVYGPGHCSEIVTDDAGQDWILFHGYPADNVDAGRCLYLEQVFWDNNGWPYIVGDKNHNTWDKPDFGKTDYTFSDVEYIDYTGDDANYYYMYDTGYVPTKATKLVFDCYSYEKNASENTFAGDKWRAVCSGRNTYSDGISVYVVPEGDKWGYFVGGYQNNGLGTHEFNTKYSISARLADITINDEKTATNRSNYTATTQRLTLFSGLQDYPYYGRIYGMKVYAPSTKLLHDFIPRLRNEDQMPVFFDAVDSAYIRPNNADGFGAGPVVDAIKNINDNVILDDNLYDLEGRRIDCPTHHGVYIKSRKKIII